MKGCICLAGLVAVVLGTAGESSAQSGKPRWTWAERPPLVAEHPVLSASLSRLYVSSTRWREAIHAVADTGRRIVVLTPDKVKVRDVSGADESSFDHDVIAEVQPIADDWSRVDTVVVVVNVPLLDRLYSDATMADFEADLDSILAHEVYGHAVPYLLAGHLSGKCADPLPRQRPADACAIKRENEIRAELKMVQRRGYGLDGLTLARRFRY
jgi:hypothetical protein